MIHIGLKSWGKIAIAMIPSKYKNQCFFNFFISNKSAAEEERILFFSKKKHSFFFAFELIV